MKTKPAKLRKRPHLLDLLPLLSAPRSSLRVELSSPLLSLSNQLVHIAQIIEDVECFLVDSLLDFLLLYDWLVAAEHLVLADFDELLVLSDLEFCRSLLLEFELDCLLLLANFLLKVLVAALLLGNRPFVVHCMQVFDNFHALVGPCFDFLYNLIC